LGDDLAEHLLCIFEQRPRCLALALVLENGRIAPLELPGLEEGCPVDVFSQFGKIETVERTGAEEAWFRRRVFAPIRLEGVGARLGERDALLFALGTFVRGCRLGVLRSNIF